MHPLFYVSTIWAVVTLALFVAVIRLSYRIEARSKPARRIPVFTNFIATALNAGVARDAQTQAIRRRMLILWSVIVLGFIVFAIILGTMAPPEVSRT